ncbi:hypothetical protein LP420_03985 [Massilia sp. B-10]|nr:hypothetical protein LP420_03985 [Massilia sp. B-10]
MRAIARHAHQRDRAARTGADGDAGPVARGAHQPHRVGGDGFVDPDPGHQLLQGDDGFRLDQRVHVRHFERVADPVAGHQLQHLFFFGLARVFDAHLNQEAVELRFGQRVSAFVFQRILRGQHHEGRGQLVGLAFDRDLALLHHLEQGRLGLG